MSSVRSRARRRIRVALLLSVGVHLIAAVVLGLFMNVPAQKPVVKQGDSLMVELATVEEPKPGTPAGREAEAVVPPSPPPAPRREAVAPAPPPPSPRPVAKTPPAERPAAPPRVASAPPSPPPAAPPAPASAPAPTDATASTAPPPPSDAVAKTPESGPAREPGPPSPAPPPPTVAAGPRDGGTPGGGRVAPDLRSLRGSGGVGTGRGGIEGAPVALNSDDPNFADYLQRVKRAIERHWAWPCMKQPGSSECRYRSAELKVEFGILKSGKLQFVELRATSGLVEYDDSAMNAIKLASPFPAVPPALMAKANRGSTGVPILANFVYEYEVSIRSLLR